MGASLDLRGVIVRVHNRVITSALSLVVALTTCLGLALVAAPAHAAAATLSYVGAASSSGNRTGHTVRIPASVQAGDTLVLFLTSNSSTATISTPNGWTQVQARDGNGTRGRAWTRTAVASNANAVVNVTTSVAVKASITVAAYRSSAAGASTVTASASSALNTSSTSHTTPTVPVAAQGSWLVNAWSEKSSTAVTWSLPTGTTSRTTTAGTGTGKVSMVLGDSGSPVAVGTGAARTATTSAAVSRDLLFSLAVSPGEEPTGPANQAPTAAFTSSCSGMTCSFDASTSADADGDALTYSWSFGDGSTGTGVTTSRTYTTAGAKTVTLTVSDGTATATRTASVSPTTPPNAGMQPVPGHTRLVPGIPRTNLPRINSGEIFDIEVVGTKVYVAGGWTSNPTNANGTTSTQRNLLKFDLETGIIDTTFRPTFVGGGVQDVEASPDGTKLFVAGRFDSVGGVAKRKFASINPTTGAPVAGFTADANGPGTELEASNTTVYLGGQFTTLNGANKRALAAVDANTGALLGRTAGNPRGTFNNDLSGGIGPNGLLTVQELKLTHDGSKLVVVHTGRQIAGQDRYGVGLVDTATQQLLPWRTRLWEDNLGFVGGIQRIFAGDIAPDDSYFVVTSASGGDRPPINDTVVSFPLTGGDDVQPNWVSRVFDSIYSVAASERGIYIGGHFSWNESPTARDPWPGLDDVGYATGQGLSGYGLGDDVVRRDHVGVLNPADGKALEWNPGSNSFEGNKAMIATPRGVITGGDAVTQGGYNNGRIAFYDFNSDPANAANETGITTPIEGRVEEAGVPFTVTGTARATSGVRQVQIEVIDQAGNRYLQDDLRTWGAANTINVTLATPNATTTNWSIPLTIEGNRAMKLQAKTFAVNGTSDSSKAIKKIETFSSADKPPTNMISTPRIGEIVTSTTFTVSGTATDDVGVNSMSYTLRDAANRYLQDDGSVSTTHNAFGFEPDVVGAPSTTWSFEATVPTEGEWKVQVTPVDTAGQPALDPGFLWTFTVNSSGVAPAVTISRPVVMNPPTAASPLTVEPGGTLTFSGTATDDEDLRSVEIQLRNSTTRENLGADGSWGTNVSAGWYRVSGLTALNGPTYNWTYTTPFTLKAGSYSFSVRATDDDELVTSNTNQGRLTINAQVAGDAAPDTLLSQTGTVTGLQSLHLDLAGTATDDKGVARVEVSLRDGDTARYLQPNGTMAAAFATLTATLATPNSTSTTWTLPVDLPTKGDWSVTAYAYDTAGQQDTATTGATARYPIYPGDLAPTVTQNLLQPTNGAVFTDGRIFVSGRVEDDQQIARAEVAIVSSTGQYLNSNNGTFAATERWNQAFLNSPGSPGSNYSLTTPVIPAGSYTVKVRGVDSNGLMTTPSTDVTVTVQVPASNAPVASFTATCTPNPANEAPYCAFDGRTSTDENTPKLTYAWNFGNGTTGTGAVVLKRPYTTAGTFTVTLTVKDEWGYTSTPATQTVTIAEPTANRAPAAVTVNAPACTGLTCSLSGSFTDNVGDSETRVWTWGDGTATTSSTSTVTSTQAQVVASTSHTYAAAGTYTVTLTVTDGWGKTTSTTRTVTVTSP